MSHDLAGAALAVGITLDPAPEDGTTVGRGNVMQFGAKG